MASLLKEQLGAVHRCYLLVCCDWELESPEAELTSLFGAEAAGKTGPLGALWGRAEAAKRVVEFQEESWYLSHPPINSHLKKQGRTIPCF